MERVVIHTFLLWSLLRITIKMRKRDFWLFINWISPFEKGNVRTRKFTWSAVWLTQFYTILLWNIYLKRFLFNFIRNSWEIQVFMDFWAFVMQQILFSESRLLSFCVCFIRIFVLQLQIHSFFPFRWSNLQQKSFVFIFARGCLKN